MNGEFLQRLLLAFVGIAPEQRQAVAVGLTVDQQGFEP